MYNQAALVAAAERRASLASGICGPTYSEVGLGVVHVLECLPPWVDDSAHGIREE